MSLSALVGEEKKIEPCAVWITMAIIAMMRMKSLFIGGWVGGGRGWRGVGEGLERGCGLWVVVVGWLFDYLGRSEGVEMGF